MRVTVTLLSNHFPGKSHFCCWPCGFCESFAIPHLSRWALISFCLSRQSDFRTSTSNRRQFVWHCMEKHISIVKGKELSFGWNKEVKHVKKKASNRIKMQTVFVEWNAKSLWLEYVSSKNWIVLGFNRWKGWFFLMRNHFNEGKSHNSFNECWKYEFHVIAWKPW